MNRYWVGIIVVMVAGCVPEVARLTDNISQRCDIAKEKDEKFVEKFADAAVKSEEPIPEFVVPLIEEYREDVLDEVDGIAKNAGALQTWSGLPEEPTEAGGAGEKRDRITLPRKAKIRNMVEDGLRRKMGKPPKPRPKAPIPEKADFPWQTVGVWAGGAVAAAFAGKKTLEARRYRLGGISLTKAIARARKNGGKDAIDEALTGDGVPKEEIAAGRALHIEAKELGEV